jgi:hypothetical protein
VVGSRAGYIDCGAGATTGRVGERTSGHEHPVEEEVEPATRRETGIDIDADGYGEVTVATTDDRSCHVEHTRTSRHKKIGRFGAPWYFEGLGEDLVRLSRLYPAGERDGFVILYIDGRPRKFDAIEENGDFIGLVERVADGDIDGQRARSGHAGAHVEGDDQIALCGSFASKKEHNAHNSECTLEGEKYGGWHVINRYASFGATKLYMPISIRLILGQFIFRNRNYPPQNRRCSIFAAASIKLPMQQFDWLSDPMPAIRAQETWHNGTYQNEALFHLVYQPRRPFAIACGAGLLADHIRRFRFSPDVITRMGQMRTPEGHNVFTESFLNHLQRLRLRANVWAAPEGMMVLPGEPLLVARGPLEQILLLETAFIYLIWRSSQWATRVAVDRWNARDWAEEDTPVAPSTAFNFDGWKIRAEYIGGALADTILDSMKEPSRMPDPQEGLVKIWETGNDASNTEIPMVQVRRLYKSQEAVGDLWLTEEQEDIASVSRTSANMKDIRTGTAEELRFSRFQNLYQPLLVKGHPAMSTPRISYLRQRTLKQLEAFHHAKLEDYPRGYLD